MTDQSSIAPLPLVVLISGAGTTLDNLLKKIASGALPARVLLVISSSPAVGGLRIAERAGIPTVVLERRAYDSTAEYSAAIFDHCRALKSPIVVLGGFLKHLLVPPDFEHRVVNIHPALIPAFCGRGFYGRRVHEAVLEHGVKLSGCTVHFVDDQYDHGPIILQKIVPVLDDDTPETLAARVFAVECEAYPEALRLLAAGRLRVEEGEVRIT